MDDQLRAYIRDTKQLLRGRQDVVAAFAGVRDQTRRDVQHIRNLADTGKPVIPEVDYKQIADGNVPQSVREKIKARGALIVRGVFPRKQVEDWNAELGAYIDENDYLKKAEEKAGLDTYFSNLKDSRPQIFGLYWSKPQIMARQAESMARTKQFLNRLWDVSGPMGDEFDPDHDFAYADRTRRRQPGDKTLGLSPHMDSGSYERWVDAAYQRIYVQFLRVVGRITIRGKRRLEPRPGNTHRLRFARCFVPFRAGRL